MQVVVFNTVWKVGGEVRQVKLYPRLACPQKHQKCKFVSRRLSKIVGSFAFQVEYVENSTSSDQWTSLKLKWESPQKYPAGKITIRYSVYCLRKMIKGPILQKYVRSLETEGQNDIMFCSVANQFDLIASSDVFQNVPFKLVSSDFFPSV